jgi:predicted ribosome quality control (RQC) complex YloA/Tae2 family protein
VEKALAGEERKRGALAKEADSARKAEKLGQWATLVVANLYRIDDRTERVVVEDWDNDGQPTELVFDAAEGTPREQADKAFTKARKLRRGSVVVAELIEQSNAVSLRLATWQKRLTEVDDDDEAALSALRDELVRGAKKLKLKADGLENRGAGGAGTDRASLPRGSRADTQPKALYGSQTPGWTGREFVSPLGVPILVGRNRRENEHLSLSVCRDPDVWFHVRGAPGAHVVLQMSRVKGKAPPSDECLQMSADLAAFYSELRDENKALVMFAAPRHVTKPNGAPLGAVKVREEGGTIVGRPASDLLPSEIKALRESERFGASPVMSGGGAKKFT